MGTGPVCDLAAGGEMRRRQPIQALAAGTAQMAKGQQGRGGRYKLEQGLPPGVTATSTLLEAGCLDVTQAPYLADATGRKDATAAIQKAVKDARDYQFVCYFPAGTYLISDTISCEQPVQKLDKPRKTDGMTQSYWDIPNRTCVLMGSTAGKRPVLNLGGSAKGFDDAGKPKSLIYIWAQTRNDAAGKAEPEWGKEQPNISFGHTFRGIDIDVRGHAGAVGIRHTGSQGATLQDCRILAEGAYAGMNNCPGQGGGTYNIEVAGGQYGILSGPECRFPILTACVFRGQTKAPVSHVSNSPPMVLVGCLIEASGPSAIDLTGNKAMTGVSLVDCVIDLAKPAPVIASNGFENLHMEDCEVRGATAVRAGGKRLPEGTGWTRIARYVASAGNGEMVVNGATLAERETAQWSRKGKAADYREIHGRHWSRLPSFEDKDAVSVKMFGAKGDGVADDTAAFQAAIAKRAKVFVPRGVYRLSQPLALGRDTALFGLHRSFAVLRMNDAGASLTMPDEAAATTSVTFLSVGGLVEWTAGRGLLVMAPAQLRVSGNGGGRFCGVTGIGRGFRVEGTKERVAFYSLNVERIHTNPQSAIRGARNVRIYYLKVEAAPHGYGGAEAVGTGNTPLGIFDSRDVRVYCVNGNVVTAEKRPMVDIVDSSQTMVFHAKSFRTGDFAQVRERWAGKTVEVGSDRTAALVVRE
jgi:hypothetical protein